MRKIQSWLQRVVWRGAKEFNEGQKILSREMKHSESKPGSATSDRGFFLSVKLRGLSPDSLVIEYFIGSGKLFKSLKIYV